MLTGTYRTPRQEQVIYGRPAAEAALRLAESFGARRLFVVSNASLAEGLAGRFVRDLGHLCVGLFCGVAAHSPREHVVAGAAAARAAGADLLVAFGGGSVIDAVKVMQICLWAGVESAEALDGYRTGIGPSGVSALAAGVRMIAVPTTLSAAEFTAFAGVTDTSRKAKEGYGHPLLAPRAVILDPALAVETPMALWLTTGMKAVDHAVEQLSSLEPTPFADAMASDGLRRLGEGLSASRADPGDIEARQTCQIGMWLAMTGAGAGRGLGPSHAIGHTLGGGYSVPHGVTSCVILPAVLTWCASANGARQAEVSRILGRPGEAAGVVVGDLVRALGLPSTLREVEIGPDQFEAIAEQTMHDRGVQTSPRRIAGPGDIVEILKLAAG